MNYKKNIPSLELLNCCLNDGTDASITKEAPPKAPALSSFLTLKGTMTYKILHLVGKYLRSQSKGTEGHSPMDLYTITHQFSFRSYAHLCQGFENSMPGQIGLRGHSYSRSIITCSPVLAGSLILNK